MKLGSHAVSARHKKRVLVTRGLKVKQSTKTSYSSQYPTPGREGHHGFDVVNQRVPRHNIHTTSLIPARVKQTKFCRLYLAMPLCAMSRLNWAPVNWINVHANVARAAAVASSVATLTAMSTRPPLVTTEPWRFFAVPLVYERARAVSPHAPCIGTPVSLQVTFMVLCRQHHTHTGSISKRQYLIQRQNNKVVAEAQLTNKFFYYNRISRSPELMLHQDGIHSLASFTYGVRHYYPLPRRQPTGFNHQGRETGTRTKYTLVSNDLNEATQQSLVFSINENGWHKTGNMAASDVLEGKVFNDCIHGHMILHPLCVGIIDTPEFQRLRNIKQNGVVYFIYPGACHNRFEHSLGVCYLAGQMVDVLNCCREQEDKITASEKLCLQVAGLCHDLGHGPFSHTWEHFLGRYNKHWKHEEQSIKMFDLLLQNNECVQKLFIKYGLEKNEINLIKSLILGHRNVSAKSYLFEIISNNENGIDVDKWDYFLRDSLQLNLKITFDHRRLLQFCRVAAVVDDGNTEHVCFRDKEVTNIHDMFLVRAYLHHHAYQHRVCQNIEIIRFSIYWGRFNQLNVCRCGDRDKEILPHTQGCSAAAETRSCIARFTLLPDEFQLNEIWVGGLGDDDQFSLRGNHYLFVHWQQCKWVIYPRHHSRVIKLPADDGKIKVQIPLRRKYRLSEAHENSAVFSTLTDHVFYSILYSVDPHLALSRSVLNRILRRELYRLVGSRRKTQEGQGAKDFKYELEQDINYPVTTLLPSLPSTGESRLMRSPEGRAMPGNVVEFSPGSILLILEPGNINIARMSSPNEDLTVGYMHLIKASKKARKPFWAQDEERKILKSFKTTQGIFIMCDNNRWIYRVILLDVSDLFSPSPGDTTEHPSGAVELNMTSALANYATEAVLTIYCGFSCSPKTSKEQKHDHMASSKPITRFGPPKRRELFCTGKPIKSQSQPSQLSLHTHLTTHALYNHKYCLDHIIKMVERASPVPLKMKPAEICEEPKLPIYEEEEIQKAMEDMSKHFLEGSDNEISSEDSSITQQEKTSNSLLHEPDVCVNIIVIDRNGCFLCPKCDKIYKNLVHLQKHLVSHQPPQFVCTICGKGYKYNSRLQNHHMHVHQDKRSFKCDLCDETYDGKYDYKKHLESHGGELPLYCALCEKFFKKKSSLRIHLSRHTTNPRFSCSHCPIKLYTKKDLELHSMKHSKDYTIKCDYCLLFFKGKKSLNVHLKTHEDKVKTKNHICEECGRQYSNMGALTNHIRSHTGEKPFKCDLCGSSFPTKCHIKKHLFCHSGIRSHKCPHCDKAYFLSSELELHMRVHSDVRQFHCNICGKGLTQRSSLKKHLERHTGTKPHKCFWCGKNFFLKSTLKQHELVHTGDNPYKCKKCGVGFNHRRKLNAHRSTHE
uniref:Uncharacterized protein n=1 Tax=Timema douglasi TaxID=61478 RepID=A0A7R8Z5T4_TIMDO|nr:unnamed protein product [Timema douglasi]